MKLSAKILSIAAIISLVGCAAFSYTEEQKAGFVEMVVTRESLFETTERVTENMSSASPVQGATFKVL